MKIHSMLISWSLGVCLGVGSIVAGCSSPAQVAPSPTSLPTSLSAVGVDWSTHFGDQEGCFAVLAVSRGEWFVNDETRCNQRFRPFSTFKIANAMIGLETGAVKDKTEVIPWDPAEYPEEDWWPENWKQENDLQMAFHRSAVPYFRAMAMRIGQEAMDKHITRLGYGNQNTGGGLDKFWLTGDIGISAVEQIAFLRSIQDGTVAMSRRTQSAIKDIMVTRLPGTSDEADHALRAKTGTGKTVDGRALAWYVGYVERGGEVYVFALNRSGKDWSDVARDHSMRAAWKMLSRLGALPPLPVQ